MRRGVACALGALAFVLGTAACGDGGNAAPDTATPTTRAAFLTADSCRDYLSYAEGFTVALTGGGGTETAKAAEDLRDAVERAPASIRADFRTLAEAYARIARAGQTPSPDAIAKLGQELDVTKVSQAADDLDAWLADRCARREKERP